MAILTDIFIIGGGINGCGIAADAAGRGLSVTLCEQGDLAQGTSSASTKLIHGGLRYLEYYEFGLVRKALIEREILLKAAPHIVQSVRLLLPYHKELRPAWLIRMGLFLYDYMGGRKLLPSTKTLSLQDSPYGEMLQDKFKKAFEYSDCTVDDARLVVLNAKAAQNKGAQILPASRVVAARRQDGCWQIDVEDRVSGQRKGFRAKLLINAAGPWISDVLENKIVAQKTHTPKTHTKVRLVKGSHIIVPRLYEHDRAYTLQGGDGRVVFTIPYERDYTLVGTTEHDYEGDLGDVQASDEEINYLCEFVGEYFKQPISPEDVIWQYAGIRPLFDEGVSEAQAATRDYILELETDGEQDAPLLNIIGGKITTYRVLAEEALAKVKSYFPHMGGNWTSSHILPGGEIGIDGYDGAVKRLLAEAPCLEEVTAQRLVRAYGSLATEVIHQLSDKISDIKDLGRHFGAGLYESELRYLIDHEWALELSDVIWRRSKLGLRLSKTQQQELSAWMQGYLSAQSSKVSMAV